MSSDLSIGIDAGSVTVKVALCAADGGPIRTVVRASRGRPAGILASALRDLLAEAGEAARCPVAITGGTELPVRDSPPVRRVNEVVAAAHGARRALPAARTVIDLGGQFSKWILLGDGPHGSATVTDFATNGLCAAGTGAFIEQQAARLKLSVDDLGDAAARAPRGASIAGRCSVFAKSDMIHLQQKGTPVDEVALGLCQSLVRTFLSTVMQGRRLRPPVVLVGGGAANPGLVRAFREVGELVGDDLQVPGDPLAIGAIGAAVLARGGARIEVGALVRALETDGEDVGCPVASGPSHLPPLTLVGGDRAVRLPEEPEGGSGEVEAFLGVDVGSVSTNLVLLAPDLRVLHGIYLPTRGQPVEVIHEGLARIRERFGDRSRILGVGTTGSGRHLAAELLGADVVRNEITAQMVSAARYVPDVDTIFEIGGQDSKYISVRDGRLADFEMNKICAAGTGSFLEEQAERLGVSILGEFAELALSAERPRDLGTRCTVFMDSELARAQGRGATVPDLCAGLAYSVSRNYLEKLVAGRRVGRCVVFQGGTASNDAVVAAFRSLLGRPVHVHPYNRISGAIGVGLLAARAKETVPYETRFAGFDACAGVELRSFECPRCENLCQVNRIKVSRRTVHFGDTCERYSERDRGDARPERPFPELFKARAELLESLAGGGEGDPRDTGNEPIALLRSSLNLEYLPLWKTLLRRLGLRPVVSPRSTTKRFEAHAGGVPSDVCLPVKVAAAQARELLDTSEASRVFVPSVQECATVADDGEASTCLYNQGLADMLRSELGDRVITAQFALRDGVVALAGTTLALARGLDRGVDEVARALAVARDVQAEFGRERKQMGLRALEAAFDRAAVVLGKPYNTHDPFVNLGLAGLLDRIGLAAIPWDLLPLDEITLDDRWRGVPWHYNREQLRAVELIRRDTRLFPILVSSYGCGPDAFLVKHLEEMLADRPRLLLEFDEHRGQAGLLTRLEAFADEIDAYLAEKPDRPSRVRGTPGTRRVPHGRRFLIPRFAEHARMYGAVLRSAGFDAEVLPQVDEDTVRLGEEHASGRECHPYAILAGEFVRLVRGGDVREDDVFLAPNCKTPCLLRQYGDGFRLIGERLGASLEVWDAAAADIRRVAGVSAVVLLHEALMATDILESTAIRLRPYVDDREALDYAFDRAMAQLETATAERRKLDGVLSSAVGGLWRLPRRDGPGSRPVVGITGDLYTRINPAGNGRLFDRLEAMGCEVWPSPSFGAMTELAANVHSRQHLQRGQWKRVLAEGLTRAITSAVRQRLVRALPVDVREIAVEPPPERFVELARPYVGDLTNHLILLGVGKIADFLGRGADGVITAAGINCMVGTAIAAAVPAIRGDHRHAPVTTLTYGGSEGLAQRLQLETFAHQVIERRRRHRGAPRSRARRSRAGISI
jgi:predicted CoA-substrate-specific enzyme activase